MKKLSLLLLAMIPVLCGKKEPYAPGLGEFMSQARTHHEKIYLAERAGNWPLVEYEIDELRETFEGAEEHVSSRPEIRDIKILYPAIERLAAVAKERDSKNFDRDYASLTQSCNQCHRKENFGFISIKTPESNPYSNQNFVSVPVL